MAASRDGVVTPTAPHADEGASPGSGVVEEPASSRDVASVDNLLALTDDGWELEEQIKTLKQAAIQKPLADQSAAKLPAIKAPALHLPTPFELAPTLIGERTAALAALERADKADKTERAEKEPTSSPSAMRPPPLPPRASSPPSKRPPPLPRSVAPPPLGAGSNARTPEPGRVTSSTNGSPLSGSNLSVSSLSPSSLSPSSSSSSSADRSGERDLSNPAALVELLQARATTLESKQPSDDRVALARAYIELAIASETLLGDEARATQHAEAALRTDPHLPAAHALLRRRKHARAALPQLLEHLREELAAANAEPAIVELLAEKARLLEALGDRGDDVRATWEQTLAKAPGHASALKGLEAELWSRAQSGSADANEALANHLARMADAYAQEPALSAWLYVERASILERKLHRGDAARAALDKALSLDPSVGPVREAIVRHAASHGDWKKLADLYAEESQIETLDARCAQLELDAASIYAMRINDEAAAVKLLESAAARAPTDPLVDRMVLDLLVRLHEGELRYAEAAKARRARLTFITDPPHLAHELRALSAIEEKLGDLDLAIDDVQRAIAIDASDPTALETLDRLLASKNRHEQRVATWLTEAARTDEAMKRARALGRAAQISEHVLGRPLDAVRHLRAAWVAAPGDAEVLDQLARLLAPAPSEAVDGEVRALIDLYAQAADSAREPGRRVAYLEKAALLWEDLVGEPSRAARAYEKILEIDPERKSAMLGLSRCAARVGDARALARALLDEAKLETDGAHKLALKTRAASALRSSDPARALSLVRDVLEHDPAHTAARTLEMRLHEDGGRWDAAAQSLRARISNVSQAPEKVALYLALAHIQHARLKAPMDAIESLEAARALDASHPVPPDQIARVLEETGDTRALREAVEKLAAHARSAEERARHLVHAAEIDELRLADDVSAARLYARALSELADSELIADRLARVLARRAQNAQSGGAGELASLTQKRIERATSPDTAQALSFELAWQLADHGAELPRAASLLEMLLNDQPKHVPALRTLESIRRRTGEWVPLARVLGRQGDAFEDVRARLGALWNLATLEEWRLPVGDPSATYKRILDLDSTDPGALESTVRRDLALARKGDPRARKAVISSLRALLPFAPDDGTRLSIQLRLALLLESVGEANPEGSGPTFAREALDRYRDALRTDELSVTAATGLARLSNRLGDAEGAVAAATALAELAVESKVRARYLVDAAELLLGTDDDVRLGTRTERRERAKEHLKKALEAEPDSIAAAGRLSTILLDAQKGEELVVLFRDAIARAKTPDAVVMLGSEIARVARDELKDLTVAIDAMRRVRAAAPQHVPSMLTLAELCIAQRAWPEAVDALEAVVAQSREVPPRLTALFALASVYEKVLSKPEEVERVLRAALALDSGNARAIKALLRRLQQLSTSADAERKAEIDGEIEGLLARLAEGEKDPDAKSDVLLDLADVRIARGETSGAERALVEAVAWSPTSAKAFARLAAFFKRPDEGPRGRDHAGYARALAQVLSFGQQIGKSDPRWLAALGQLEVESLSRLREGINHLQRAVQLDPSMYETRFELAQGYARMSANEEATRVLLAMLSPNPRPLLSIADPPAALELLERSLGAERRGEEAIVVSELRAVAGELDDGRNAWLRARRLGPIDPHHQMLDRATLVTHVLPQDGRHVLLEVAAAVAGVEAKVLRADVSELGIGPRDRVSPRSGHPTRALMDRVAKQLGLSEVELIITPNVTRTRVLAHDVPWLVVPRSLADLPEPIQLASLGRALARIAFGVPWLEELPPPHIEALLIAAARQVVPGFAADDIDVLSSKLVASHEAAIARVLSRRQKKLLEELAPHIAAPQGRPLPIDAFISALARGELRAAYVLTGDLLATIDELRSIDPDLNRTTDTPSPNALAAVLEHAYAGDVARYALTSEATAIRRRVGSTWTG